MLLPPKIWIRKRLSRKNNLLISKKTTGPVSK